MRWFLVCAVMLISGCQSNKSEPDYSTKPTECDKRAADSGLCVPGGYEDS